MSHRSSVVMLGQLGDNLELCKDDVGQTGFSASQRTEFIRSALECCRTDVWDAELFSFSLPPLLLQCIND